MRSASQGKAAWRSPAERWLETLWQRRQLPGSPLQHLQKGEAEPPSAGTAATLARAWRAATRRSVDPVIYCTASAMVHGLSLDAIGGIQSRTAQVQAKRMMYVAESINAKELSRARQGSSPQRSIVQANIQAGIQAATPHRGAHLLCQGLALPRHEPAAARL